MIMTSFQIEIQSWIRFTLLLDNILHYKNINGLEQVRFDAEHTVIAGQETMVFRLFEMLSQSRQMFQKNLWLVTSHCFHDKFVILREKEEGTAFSSSLARGENVVKVVFNF